VTHERVEFYREVAVAVAHRPEVDERVGTYPGLLEKLPPRGGFRPLVPSYLSSRELPESRKETGRWPSLDEIPFAVDERHDRGPDVRTSGPTRPPRQRSGVCELATCATTERHRAVEAVRSGRPTDRLPELHHRLVEPPGFARGEDRGEARHETRPDAGVAKIALLARPSGRDPKAVRFERDRRRSEGDRRDRPGDVGTHAGERLEFRDGTRELSSMFAEELFRGFVKVVSTGIVPGAFPELQDAADRSARQRLDRRELPDEPLEVRDRLRDSSLLQ
jgi:hypothetical protein